MINFTSCRNCGHKFPDCDKDCVREHCPHCGEYINKKDIMKKVDAIANVKQMVLNIYGEDEKSTREINNVY